MLIILDPGHGGHERSGNSSPFGVRGPAGTIEKDVTLRLARRLSEHLGTGVALTRYGDSNPSLGARAEAARRNGARVFVSLHANSGAPGSCGTEIWVHGRAPQHSRALAQAVQGSLARLGGPAHAIQHGDFAVLTPERLAPETAACLVEVDFLSDPQGERRLGNPGGLESMARALAQGIRAYLGEGRVGGSRAVAAAPRRNGQPGEHETYGRALDRFARSPSGNRAESGDSTSRALSDDDMGSLGDDEMGPPPLARNQVVAIEVRDPDGAVTGYSHEYPVKPDSSTGGEDGGVQITLPDLAPLRAREIKLIDLRQQVADAFVAARLFPRVNVNVKLAEKAIAYEQPVSPGSTVYLRVLQRGGVLDPASGGYPVNDGGEIDLPRLGVVQAGGKTLGDLEQTLLKAINDARVFSGAVVDLSLEELR